MQKDAAFDALSTQLHTMNKAGGVTDANKKARERIDTAWETQNGRWSLVSGKALISGLSGWSQERFGVSLNPLRIIKEMNRYEIDSEVTSVITSIEKKLPFSNIDM